MPAAILGETRKAKDIEARLLWTKRDDIKWALEVCTPGHRDKGYTPSNTIGVIFVGGHHENDPEQVWATKNRPANHLETVYQCIYIAPPWPPADTDQE
jgi:hypothetical protein